MTDLTRRAFMGSAAALGAGVVTGAGAAGADEPHPTRPGPWFSYRPDEDVPIFKLTRQDHVASELWQISDGPAKGRVFVRHKPIERPDGYYVLFLCRVTRTGHQPDGSNHLIETCIYWSRSPELPFRLGVHSAWATDGNPQSGTYEDKGELLMDKRPTPWDRTQCLAIG